MRYQHPLLLLGFFGIGLAACRKDKDVLPPTVSILAPAAGSTLQVPDTLVVTVSAGDDERVERITIGLVDANGVPVTTGSGISPGTNPATVVLELSVLSEQLESGTYTLVATASDGEAVGRASRPITVIEAPFRLRSIYAVTTPTDAQADIHRIDSTGQVALAGTFTGDLSGAAISSRAQLLFLAGSTTGPLQAIDPADFLPRWERPNLGILGAPYFSALQRGADGRVYICAEEGRVRGFEEGTGSGTMVTAPVEGYRSECLFTLGDLVISAERQVASQTHRLRSYQRTSGVLQSDHPLDQAPIALFQRNGDALLIFGNRDGHGVVEERVLPFAGGWEPFSWPTVITAVAQVDANTWIVALENGSLERYTYSNSSSVPIATGPTAHALAFDPAGGAVIVGTDGQVILRDPLSGTAIASYDVPGDVRYVLPLFNREP